MTQNIEQRTEAAVTKYETASDAVQKLVNTDAVVETPVGARDSFPKISREAKSNFEDQLVKNDDEFQKRFILSESAKAWATQEEVTDKFQRYYTGAVGSTSYAEHLPNPAKLPFTTGASFQDDVNNELWIEHGVASTEWTEQYVGDTAGKRWAINTEVTDPEQRFVYDGVAYIAPTASEVSPVMMPAQPEYPFCGVREDGALDISVWGDAIDRRDVILSLQQSVFIGKGYRVRCHLNPEDDIRLFVGKGEVISRDLWGNEHVFNIEAANQSSSYSPSQIVNQALRLGNDCRLGILGDSITDGAHGDSWIANPTDANGDLNSADYNHNFNGGSGSWFRTFTDLLNQSAQWQGKSPIKACNASSSGKRLIDGWAYRNFDYGFFQNQAYGNTSPKALYIAMGVNDNGLIIDFDDYLDEFDKLIRKAWGYGVAVGVVSVTTKSVQWAQLDAAIKMQLSKKYPNLEIIDIATGLNDLFVSGVSPSPQDLWLKSDGTWDTTHPQKVGQEAMGAIAAKQVVPWFYREEPLIMPVSESGFLSVGYPSGLYYQADLAILSGKPWLDESGGWPIVSPNESVTHRYYLWVDDPRLDLIIFQPFQNTYGDVASMSVRVRLNDIRTEPYISDTLPVEMSDQYTTYQIQSIKKGLNIVEIAVGGSPSIAYKPALIKAGSMYGTSTLNANRSLNSGEHSRIIDSSLPTMLMDFTAQSMTGEAPDFVVSKSYPITQSLRLNRGVSEGGGVLLCWKESAKKGLAAICYTSSIAVYPFDNESFGSMLGTLAVSPDSGFTMTIQHTPTGVSIRAFNDTQSDYLDVPDRRGGSIGLINNGDFTVNFDIDVGIIVVGG
ncbi:TPA: SGNH/GDSL hydrolase family protein [Vibrio parahaemolyticus]